MIFKIGMEIIRNETAPDELDDAISNTEPGGGADDSHNENDESSSDFDGLLIYNDVSTSVITTNVSREISLQNEIERFLSSKNAKNVTDGLAEYPTIRKLFLKFNCIRSTEAICERLFSYAGKNFYCLLVLK